MKKFFALATALMASASVALATGTGTESGTGSATGSGAQAGRINDTFNVGQIYIGAHMGMTVPTAIGGKEGLAFNDVAKVGFALYADGMWQMSQSIGLGAELGYKTYPYNDKKTWGSLTRYGAFEAKYQSLGLGVNGRIFFTTNSVRPFFGVHAGGSVLMNSVDFVPNKDHQELQSTQYKTNNISPDFGVLAGAYLKAGKRTLLSFQARLSFVTNLEDGIIEVTNRNGDIQSIAQNQHGSQTNISITVGLHVGKNKNNKH